MIQKQNHWNNILQIGYWKFARMDWGKQVGNLGEGADTCLLPGSCRRNFSCWLSLVYAGPGFLSTPRHSMCWRLRNSGMSSDLVKQLTLPFDVASLSSLRISHYKRRSFCSLLALPLLFELTRRRFGKIWHNRLFVFLEGPKVGINNSKCLLWSLHQSVGAKMKGIKLRWEREN